MNAGSRISGARRSCVSGAVSRGPCGLRPRGRRPCAVFQATGRFHDPAHAVEWDTPEADADFEATVDLLLRGLRA
ncbi:hypothetical protein [Streptomyces albogriseolus]|uniref:hypothetical protein n=1 Tax=Streptomyces albogriseolus TaxID=1887 RepID=UPI0036F9A042